MILKVARLFIKFKPLKILSYFNEFLGAGKHFLHKYDIYIMKTYYLRSSLKVICLLKAINVA